MFLGYVVCKRFFKLLQISKKKKKTKKSQIYLLNKIYRLEDDDRGSVLAAWQVRKERPQPTVSEPDLGDGR